MLGVKSFGPLMPRGLCSSRRSLERGLAAESASVFAAVAGLPSLPVFHKEGGRQEIIDSGARELMGHLTLCGNRFLEEVSPSSITLPSFWSLALIDLASTGPGIPFRTYSLEKAGIGRK